MILCKRTVSATSHGCRGHPPIALASLATRAQPGRVVETGYAAMSRELPGGGWPTGALIDLLVQQPGVGELRLLSPALASGDCRPIAFLQSPHIPCSHGLATIGLDVGRIFSVKAESRRTRSGLRSRFCVVAPFSAAVLGTTCPVLSAEAIASRRPGLGGAPVLDDPAAGNSAGLVTRDT